MRIELALLALTALPALAAAQSNPALGPCAGAGPLDSAAKAEIVAKPDRKPRRTDNGIEPVVENSRFRMMTPSDEDRNDGDTGPRKWVVVTAIIDTTGHVDPRTPTILQSSSIPLSHAVCDALPKMAFTPALLKGQKVPAEYKERFVFRQSVTDIGNNPTGNGGDRH
jgi:hypothetical protein